MRQLILVSTAMLSAIFLLVGCGGGGFQAEKEHHAHQSRSARLALHPEGDSGVRGTATFEEISKGVLVKLQLRNLPKPDTLYLAHIHPGTCAQGEEGEGGALEHAGKIEYPLSQVKSNSEGDGSSNTTLHHTSVEKLYSGGPKHVNVHKAGTGDPPILACANLKGALSPAKKKQGEREGARQAQTTTPEPTASTHSSKSASGSTSGGQQAAQSEADCRLVLYVANKNMSPKEAEAFSKLLTEMISSMEGLSWPEGTLRNAALDHLAVPRYRECKHIE